MKICFFGGTFNPVHNGHVRLLENAKEYFGFDKIIAHLDDFVHGIPTKKMGVYRDEMMVFLAIFLAYLCLISNHLEEDLDEFWGNCIEFTNILESKLN